MLMKWSIFKLLLVICFFPCLLYAQEEASSTYVRQYDNFWERLIPRYVKLQYAGSMGMFSLGTGWDYYRHHWETDILVGFVPAGNSDGSAHATLTFKQNYYPWNIDLGTKFSIEPLAAGLYVNFIFGEDFWTHQPDRYPSGYYWFSTRIRTHVFLGERVTLKLDPEKIKIPIRAITLFYELSTCDLYIINKIGNSSLKAKDYLSLSFGIKWQIL